MRARLKGGQGKKKKMFLSRGEKGRPPYAGKYPGRTPARGAKGKRAMESLSKEGLLTSGGGKGGCVEKRALQKRKGESSTGRGDHILSSKRRLKEGGGDKNVSAAQSVLGESLVQTNGEA